MGSADDKSRKSRHPLAKVQKYEEPNALPLPGLTGAAVLVYVTAASVMVRMTKSTADRGGS